MGKARRNRSKHQPKTLTLTPMTSAASSQDEQMEVVYSEPTVRFDGNEGSIFPKNVFNASSAASIYDEFGAKKAREREFDARSVITSISRAENRHLTKKEKRKIKHEVFVEKMEAIRKQQKEMKEKQKRAARPVVGDLTSLADALPELTPLEELAMDLANSSGSVKTAGDLMREWTARIRKDEEEELRQRVAKSLKARTGEQAEHIKIFKAILDNPEYKKYPERTISTHVQLKLLEEAKKTS